METDDNAAVRLLRAFMGAFMPEARWTIVFSDNAVVGQDRIGFLSSTSGENAARDLKDAIPLILMTGAKGPMQ